MVEVGRVSQRSALWLLCSEPVAVVTGTRVTELASCRHYSSALRLDACLEILC